MTAGGGGGRMSIREGAKNIPRGGADFFGGTVHFDQNWRVEMNFTQNGGTTLFDLV